VDGHDIGPGPWGLVERLPLLDTLIVSRLSIIAIPFLALILCTVVARATVAGPDRTPQARRTGRYVLLAAVLALMTVVPVPLTAGTVPPIPHFITAGTWRETITPNSVVMTVPMTMSNGGIDTILWQVPSDGQFKLVGGYFFGPHGADLTGHPFPENTATQRMINTVWLNGKPPAATGALRAQAKADLITLQVDAIVVAQRGHTQDVLNLLTGLLGTAPNQIDDVWVWHIQHGVAIQTVN
jgi:hypothetical protein